MKAGSDLKYRQEAQLFQDQKMEAIGRVAGRISHDFNNRMTSVIGFGKLILMRLAEDDPLRKDIEEIVQAGEQASALTKQLLAFSRKQIFQTKVIDLNTVIIDLKKTLERLTGEDVELKTFPEPELKCVEVDPGQMEQVIRKLVVNAGDAMPRGGKITIETANAYPDEADARGYGVEVKPGPYVMLSINDTGCGMDEETKAHLFEPFFTTKADGMGAGLDLATVYGIVTQSGGHIRVYSEPGEGTTFKIYLPAIASAQARPPAEAEQGGRARRAGLPGVEGEAEPVEREQTHFQELRGSETETILVVEDDKSVRNLTRKALKEYGYSVIEAQNGEDALKVSEAHEGPIHLMITDVVMPGMNGRELAERLQPYRPKTRVLYMSGYADDAIVHHGVLEPGLSFIPKPFTPESLVNKARSVLDSGRRE